MIILSNFAPVFLGLCSYECVAAVFSGSQCDNRHCDVCFGRHVGQRGVAFSDKGI